MRRRLYAAAGVEPRDVVVFTLFRNELAESPAASAQLEAYDASGERVL